MINDLAIYDLTTMPALAYPINIKQKKSKKYLGNKYIKGDITVDSSILPKNYDEVKALYNFWENDCLSGTKAFIMQLDVLGINSENNNLLGVEWNNDFVPTVKSRVIPEIKVTLLLKYKVNSLNELIKI